MSPARQLHNAEVNVSKATEKAVASREKEAAKNREQLNRKIERAAEKADADEKKRA